METELGTTRSLTAGLLVSVGFHAALGLVLAQYGDRLGSVQTVNQIPEVGTLIPLPELAEPKDELRAKELHLGIEKSSVVTETWLGFSDPSEHSGPLASVEQAAMALRAAGSPEADQPEVAASDAAFASPAISPPSEAPAPQPFAVNQETPHTETAKSPGGEPGSVASTDLTARAETQKSQEAEHEEQPLSEPVSKQPPARPDAPLPAPVEEKPSPDELTLEREQKSALELKPLEPETSLPREAAKPDLVKQEAKPDDREDLPRSADLPPAEGVKPPLGEPSNTSQPTVPSPLLPPQVAPTTSEAAARPSVDAAKKIPKPQRVSGDLPGVMSDRESVAAALKEAIDVRPGRPAAAEGLKIKTTNPRWSVTTQLTASPRNPVVWIAFGRNGKVIDADFLNGENTGSRAVDEPLLHAIFTWRAKGVAIDELPPSDPKAAVRVVLRITLRGS